MAPRKLPYGSWRSPISAELIAADAVGLSAICVDGHDVYWIELRGAEGGRNAIVRCSGSRVEDVLLPPYSARSRVNEYGGGAFTVCDGIVYFVNNSDQRIYRLPPGSAPFPITPADARRYADLIVDRSRRRVIAVCEDHRSEGEPPQSIVALDVAGEALPIVLASGRDFYAAPRLSSDGCRLAFLAWDHPNMPWDGTELCLAVLSESGNVVETRRVAGGNDESITQPTFGPDGALYFISDRSGWWNLYRWGDEIIEPLAPRPAEFSGPQWVFGLSTYAFTRDGRIACAYNERGTWRLCMLNAHADGFYSIELPYSDIAYVNASGESVWFLGTTPSSPSEIVELNLTTRQRRIVRRSATVNFSDDFFSSPTALEYQSQDGEYVHAFYYPPQNPDFAVAPNERPPLIVMSHGGPTAATTSALNLKVQYWTSRGFAVIDVNYRGSSGYGRAYRRRLNGSWGIVDVEDCIAGAKYLASRGEVDDARLIIRGGSAGGYTTLCALTFHNIFRVGASHYGISDLELLAKDTHKFESRYLDRLIGPYPAARDVYRKRSPIHYAERLNCPVIFFQGAEDRVVPPEQTERFVQALRARAIPVSYVLFPEESHGFRRAENVRRALESELHFYGRVLGFETEVYARI